MTSGEIELLTDIDAHLMIERGTRGGVSGIFHKFAKANSLLPEKGQYPNRLIKHILMQIIYTAGV